MIGTGLEHIRQLGGFRPQVPGTQQLEVSVLTSEGCTDVSRVKREVVVLPTCAELAKAGNPVQTADTSVPCEK